MSVAIQESGQGALRKQLILIVVLEMIALVAAAIAMWLGVKREDLVRTSAKDRDPNDPNAGAVV